MGVNLWAWVKSGSAEADALVEETATIIGRADDWLLVSDDPLVGGEIAIKLSLALSTRAIIGEFDRSCDGISIEVMDSGKLRRQLAYDPDARRWEKSGRQLPEEKKANFKRALATRHPNEDHADELTQLLMGLATGIPIKARFPRPMVDALQSQARENGESLSELVDRVFLATQRSFKRAPTSTPDEWRGEPTSIELRVSRATLDKLEKWCMDLRRSEVLMRALALGRSRGILSTS